MERLLLKDLFIAPTEVINRAPNSITKKIFGDIEKGTVAVSGCQCVNCRSCDNGCNK